jgi:hypothetical protein
MQKKKCQLNSAPLVDVDLLWFTALAAPHQGSQAWRNLKTVVSNHGWASVMKSVACQSSVRTSCAPWLTMNLKFNTTLAMRCICTSVNSSVLPAGIRLSTRRLWEDSSGILQLFAPLFLFFYWCSCVH